ncbi:MAG: hypothetical protein N3B13_02855 [Deltaproteobacteria bacterium]|nr:hypothetical protein [Deltaproteobacteria bacterium]
MKRILFAGVIISLVIFSCRIRSIEPEDYKPQTEGHLSPKEVKEIIEYKFSKAGIKLAPFVTLNLRGIKIRTDGYDSNLNVGYVYLIEPPENIKFTEEYQRPLTKSEMEELERLRKTEGYYILFINEGPREKVEAAADEFLQLLYSRNVLLKYKTPEPEKEKQEKSPQDTSKGKSEEKSGEEENSQKSE